MRIRPTSRHSSVSPSNGTPVRPRPAPRGGRRGPRRPGGLRCVGSFLRRKSSGTLPTPRPCPSSSRIVSTTLASASVVVSPSARPWAMSRSSRRMILPERVFGRSGVNISDLGLRDRADLRRDVVAQLLAERGVGSLPRRRITNAMIASPVTGSGSPTTAASATAGCDDERALDLGRARAGGPTRSSRRRRGRAARSSRPRRAWRRRPRSTCPGSGSSTSAL